jgi:O-methyltransferase involved in polyketide biosynthesis
VRIKPELDGVPETALWTLWFRSLAARGPKPLLHDPMAIEVVERIDYPFEERFGKLFPAHAQIQALRVLTFDREVKRYIADHPDATVVALGEGLETQFWRVDDGRVRWLTVDLPAVLDLRRRVLPEGPRQSSHAGSALELGWLDRLDPAEPVLITAQGLLVYFQRNEVHELIAAVAERLPGSSFVFDVVPERMLDLVRRQSGRERDQAIELWSWLFNLEEREAIRRIRGVAGIRDLVPPLAPGVVPLALGAVRRLPRRVRYALPVLPVLQLTFR